VLRPVHSDATQLNSTSSWVELRRYRHPHRRNSTVADDRQCDWPSWTAYSQSARLLHCCDVWYTNQRRSFPYKCFLAPLLFLHGRWRYWSIRHINRHVFFHNSISFSSNSSLQNSISRQTRQKASYMTYWVNWVTTFRTDRWQLFTLWTCRQLDVELSWCCVCVAIDTSPTQLNSTWVELCRYKRAFSDTNACTIDDLNLQLSEKSFAKWSRQ